MAMHNTRAYSYIRFSSERQRLGDSKRRQLELAQAYAREHDLILDESTYQDLGVSAFDRSNEQAALGAFLTAVKNGQVSPGSFLLVENFDRLSRAGIFATLDLLAQLVDAEISVVILSEGRVYDRSNKNDTLSILTAVIFAARAFDESMQKSRRVREVRQAKRDALREGKIGTRIMSSQCPRWLEPNEDKTGFIPISDKVDSVRKVFDALLTGRGRMSIAREANEEKWPVPGRGTTWHGSLVSKILKNRAVLGEYQPLIHRDGKRIPEGNPILGYYPTILDEKTFYAAQAVLAQHKTLPRRRDSGYFNVFQGALRCGKCGASMGWKNKAGKKNGPRYAIYMCTDRVRGVTTCPSQPIRKEGSRFELALLAALHEMHFGRVAAQGALASLRQEQSSLEAQLDHKQEALQRIADLLEQAKDSSTLLSRLMALEIQTEVLNTKVQETKMQIAQTEAISGWDEEEQTKALEVIARKLDDPEGAAFRAELRDRILAVVESIYIFATEGIATIVWKGEPVQIHHVMLSPESGAAYSAAVKGKLPLPPVRKARVLVNMQPRPPRPAS